MRSVWMIEGRTRHKFGVNCSVLGSTHEQLKLGRNGDVMPDLLDTHVHDALQAWGRALSSWGGLGDSLTH